MRKIETDMCAAIRAGKPFTSGNTRTATNGPLMDVFLHGHLIARRMNGTWRFNLCGWNTPTTRSRINAIARTFGRAGVNCKAGVAHCDGVAIDSKEWF